MQPLTKVYEVYSQIKGGTWGGSKRVTKNLTLEPSGLITIMCETEELMDTLYANVSEIH